MFCRKQNLGLPHNEAQEPGFQGQPGSPVFLSSVGRHLALGSRSLPVIWISAARLKPTWSTLNNKKYLSSWVIDSQIFIVWVPVVQQSQSPNPSSWSDMLPVLAVAAYFVRTVAQIGTGFKRFCATRYMEL